MLWDAIRRLEKVRPTFVSVTYGAGGGTRDRTIRMTERIALETELLPMAHLTCVGHSVTELRSVIGALPGVGIRNLLALRGDPPGRPGPGVGAHPEGLDHADELVELARSLGHFTSESRPSPTGTPRARALDYDAEVLVRKADAGAEYAITQFFFTVEAYLAAARPRGRPVAGTCRSSRPDAGDQRRQLARMTQLVGAAGAGVGDVDRLEAVGDDPDAVREVGVEITTELAQRAARRGRARHPLHHDEPVVGDAAGVRQPGDHRGAVAVRRTAVAGVAGRRRSYGVRLGFREVRGRRAEARARRPSAWRSRRPVPTGRSAA